MRSAIGNVTSTIPAAQASEYSTWVAVGPPTVSAAIGPAEFAAAYQRGRALTRADALALAP